MILYLYYTKEFKSPFCLSQRGLVLHDTMRDRIRMGDGMDKEWTPDIYGDVPVAYAVYKLLFAKDGRTVRDTEYVFVNEIYCEMAGVKKEDLLGKSFLSVYANGDPIWMAYCIRTGSTSSRRTTRQSRTPLSGAPPVSSRRWRRCSSSII